MRLWLLGSNQVLLDDERPTLHELRLDERSRLLLEVRNPDLTWPEEIGALGGGCRATERRETLIAPNLPGATGLHNLGNTCFMNAALQSVWNTGPLTRYFNSGMHLYEVNTTNPLGTKGVLALRFGELCKEVWSCSARSVAPLRVRWCVSRHARALAGGGQHDAQELLAWLLDALHEDLNRATPAPTPAPTPTPTPTPAPAPAQRPDQQVAAEAWACHAARNRSVVTELFYGQLRSRVRCEACGTGSVRFDAFNMLSLPLPVDACLRVELTVILLDGSVPVKYGVRVNSEGTYLDLKKKLSELCGLPPESMLVAELSGAQLGRVLADDDKLVAARDLLVYELPADHDETDSDDELPRDTHGWSGSAGAWSEVSVGRGGNSSSLCMPALFCFKRSRSEILMSQSPPSTFYGNRGPEPDHRCNTLPKELKREVNGSSSPTLSVKSLTLKPTSPRLAKVKFGSSPSNMYKMDEVKAKPAHVGKIRYLVAVHRKTSVTEATFAWSRVSLFGSPLVVVVRGGQSGRALYRAVWTQVARLLSARPPRPRHNHATDCDDSLGYEFPFTLRLVSSGGGGAWCGVCEWPALCRGCALPSDDAPLVTRDGKRTRPRRKSAAAAAEAVEAREDAPDADSPIAKAKLHRHSSTRHTNSDGSSPGTLHTLDLSLLREVMRRTGQRVMLAIDWDPTALHLRYQSTREKSFTAHWSVAWSLAEAARPVDLGSCLRAFTSEERLDERYHCEPCRAAQPATKNLQIWRLPPILVIHLKRFQYVNNKWIKSQKVVNFPFQDFDPTAYLASIPQETIRRHMRIHNIRPRVSIYVDAPMSDSESEDDNDENQECVQSPAECERPPWRRTRVHSASLSNTPVTDDNLVDYHQHHLQPDQDNFDLKYRLYAVVSHSGQMSGGHYVAYARNPSGTWLCYNDSMVRTLSPTARPPHPAPVPPIDPSSAYLLFYERQGLDYEQYLPDVSQADPKVGDFDLLDPDDTDLKKMCVVA